MHVVIFDENHPPWSRHGTALWDGENAPVLRLRSLARMEAALVSARSGRLTTVEGA